MKITLSFLAIFSLGILTAPQFVKASPVSEESIPAGVEWFIHLDADLLRQTRSGQAFFHEFRNVMPIDEETKKQMPIDPVLILDGIRGLTLFGDMPDMSTGNPEDVPAVVLLEGTPDMMQVLRGLISGMQLENPEAIANSRIGETSIMTLKEEGLHGCFVGDNRFLLSKSLLAMSEFLTVNSTGQNHINLDQRFPTYRLGERSGVFFGAFVEGLGSLNDLPAQARILKLTQAVSIQLGEAGDSVNLMASLVTDSDQTGQQVQEVLQGILALFMMTQNGQPDVATLIQSARVDRQGTAVSLNLSYPVERVEQWAVVLAEMVRQEIESSQTPPPSGNDSAPESSTGE